jgi:hypothetical protein
MCQGPTVTCCTRGTAVLQCVSIVKQNLRLAAGSSSLTVTQKDSTPLKPSQVSLAAQTDNFCGYWVIIPAHHAIKEGSGT